MLIKNVAHFLLVEFYDSPHWNWVFEAHDSDTKSYVMYVSYYEHTNNATPAPNLMVKGYTLSP
jgi:hypothetical protein